MQSQTVAANLAASMPEHFTLPPSNAIQHKPMHKGAKLMGRSMCPTT